MASRSSPREALDVSAIIITRNEEAHIEHTIGSVLEALEQSRRMGLLRTSEVILVDSASTDRTVEIAVRHPIRIVRLRSGWPLSAAAGRATGARLASGRLLLFVDGDYSLDPNWLVVALRTVEEPRVGAVCGLDLEDAGGSTILVQRWTRVLRTERWETIDVDSIATGLVRRDAYDAVGGIHPYLRGAEDRDLGFRLLAAGWRILRTREPMGVHHWVGPGTRMNYVEYFRSVALWSLGEGQACRARWDEKPLRRKFLGRYATARFLIQGWHLFGLVALLIVNLAGVLAGVANLLAALGADIAFLTTLWAWKRRNRWTWREAGYELVYAAVYGGLRQAAFAVGLLLRSPSPESYPRDVEVVAEPGVPEAGGR